MNQNPQPNHPDHTSWVLYRRLLAYVLNHKLVMVTGLIGFTIFAASGPAAT